MRSIHLRYSEVEPGIGLVCLEGRLDVRAVPQIQNEFESRTASAKKPVIVDLSGVELMNSVGLGLLMANANSLRALGAAMILLSPQPRVEKVIRMASVEQLLPIVHDLHEALSRIKRAA